MFTLWKWRRSVNELIRELVISSTSKKCLRNFDRVGEAAECVMSLQRRRLIGSAESFPRVNYLLWSHFKCVSEQKAGGLSGKQVLVGIVVGFPRAHSEFTPWINLLRELQTSMQRKNP